MKSKFDWYFNPSKNELDEIWKNGILTVDTNVLLDLYRYHKSTRDSLLISLQKFEGKKWISNQAAQEFIRNRTKVIVSTGKTFQDAKKETQELLNCLSAAIEKLKGKRIIPQELIEELNTEVGNAISKALSSIEKSKTDYPNFLKSDTVLEQLFQIFGDSVGDAFKELEIDDIKAEAAKRIAEKIPPGYLDADKDGERSFGDYFLWRQILEFAKESQRPIVLVTSEQSEDWWEIISGRTTGPRPELLREAKTYSGQRILIYRTEQFLKYALERSKEPVNDVAIEEILAINKQRSSSDIAVKLIEQATTESTTHRNTGVLTLNLLRPVNSFTVSGHFLPNMIGIPNLKATCIRTPPDCPDLRIGAGTGTNHDFNIHASSRDGQLPLGIYEFQYDANCEDLLLAGEVAAFPNTLGPLTLTWSEVSEGHE